MTLSLPGEVAQLVNIIADVKQTSAESVLVRYRGKRILDLLCLLVTGGFGGGLVSNLLHHLGARLLSNMQIARILSLLEGRSLLRPIACIEARAMNVSSSKSSNAHKKADADPRTQQEAQRTLNDWHRHSRSEHERRNGSPYPEDTDQPPDPYDSKHHVLAIPAWTPVL